MRRILICLHGKTLTLCPWVIFHVFLSSADFFFQNRLFLKKPFRNTISESNSLDPDQARQDVRPDLDPKCLQKLSADDTMRQRVNKKIRDQNAPLIAVYVFFSFLTVKAPPIICSRRQFQILPLFQNNK